MSLAHATSYGCKTRLRGAWVQPIPQFEIGNKATCKTRMRPSRNPRAPVRLSPADRICARRAQPTDQDSTRQLGPGREVEAAHAQNLKRSQNPSKCRRRRDRSLPKLYQSAPRLPAVATDFSAPGAASCGRCSMAPHESVQRTESSPCSDRAAQAIDKGKNVT